MTSITLREVDPLLLGKLTLLAKKQNVSIEREIVILLKQALSSSHENAILERIDAIAAMTPKGVRQTDSTKLVREDRDL